LIYIAQRTIIAIENSIYHDQGNAYRANLQRVLPHLSDAYRAEHDGHRSHLGASILGTECGRHAWYNFRWAVKPKFQARMLRLFNRGHIEEGRIIAALLSMGTQVYQQDENGKQFRISMAGGHAGGSGDGVAVNLPDLSPGQPALLEFKTHNDKSFVKLAGENWNQYVEQLLDPNKPEVTFVGEGVRSAKFEHYVQANLYMRRMGLAVCLYVAINKNDDAMYCELVPADTAIADQFIDRAEKLVFMNDPPKKLNESAGFWKCRFCDHRPVCHLREAPDKNCRTCAYSMPKEDGTWFCRLREVPLDKQTQLTGCPEYQVKKTI
jgi:hypothetical protein